jgi:invasion protein IalB
VKREQYACIFASLFASLVIAHCANAQTEPKPPAGAGAPAPAKKPAVQVPPGQDGGQAPGQNKGPDMTTETYGDWIMRCQTAAEGKRCEVSQSIVLQGQPNPIAQIAVGREKKSDPMRLVVQLPTNITFEGGVKTLLANGDSALDLSFKRCFPIGCFADAPLNDAVLSKLKAQTEPGSMKFKDGVEREISLPLSMRGFGTAVEALSRS